MRLRDIVTEKKDRGIYRPQDLFAQPHAAANVREWFRRAARRDGLDEEAADEAASVAFMAWLERDYSNGQVARGDHPRALFGTRKFMRRSCWKGGSEYRKAQARQFTPTTGSEASRGPTPDAIVAALEAAETRGLSYVPCREKWSRRGWKKVGRGASAHWEETGRTNHRGIQRSYLSARRVIAEASRVGGLVAVFMPQE